MKLNNKKILRTSAVVGLLVASAAYADQVILDDLIVDGSICAGMDCVNGESFGFDTIRLKENNLRIRFVDTSSTSSFPSRDWQITANDSANGGANKFSIDDIDGGRTPFTLEAGAPSHSLYVDDGGRLGLGTSTPFVDLHIKTGNTPTLRLEQDGSSGFTPQTWDVAGNEANFFVRDATNGSTLPFRIRPGAPSSSIDIDPSGRVGIQNSSAEYDLHVKGDAKIGFKNGTTDEGNLYVRKSIRIGDFDLTEFDVENQSVVSSYELDIKGDMNVRALADGTKGEINAEGSINAGGGLVEADVKSTKADLTEVSLNTLHTQVQALDAGGSGGSTVVIDHKEYMVSADIKNVIMGSTTNRMCFLTFTDRDTSCNIRVKVDKWQLRLDRGSTTGTTPACKARCITFN